MDPPTVHTSHQCLAEATTLVNTFLHLQARKLYSEYKDNPKLYTKMDIEKYQLHLDPQLIDFVILQSPNKTSERQEESTQRRKTIRHLYAISVLLFITDNTCCMPFHVPVIETVLSHSGSQKLARVLNH